MTDPYAPPPHEPWAPPPSEPYAPPPPGWTYQRLERPWHRRPGSVMGSAVFASVSAWSTVVVILLGWALVDALNPNSGAGALMIIFGFGFVLLLLFAVGVAAFAVSVVAMLTTIPLAVAWWRSGDRSQGPLGALATAAAGWAVLGFLLVRLGIIAAFA